MWRHYLLTLYRALTRHRLYAAINVLGLALGIAVFLALSLYVRFETSFERWLPNSSSIYLVHTAWVRTGHGVHEDDNSMGGLLEELKEDYPQLVGTRIMERRTTVRQGAEVTSEIIDLVDPDFFKVFDLPLVSGDKAQGLLRPDQILLSESRAKRYFGALNPIGQRLTVVMGGGVQDFRVAGVLKEPPANTDLKFDLVAPLTPQVIASQGRTWRRWGSEQLSTYLRFDDPAGAATLNADLDRFVDRHAAGQVGADVPHKSIRISVAPLTDQHLRDPRDAAAVATLGAVGLLTLLLAGVNYVNLATARASLRAKEVALRKVMGATGRALIAQFLVEALATAAVATLIGLALCELALPAINAAGGLALKISYLGSASVAPLLIGVILAVGLVAGAYPAFILSSFRPAGVLAAARTPGGGRMGGRVREALVLLQFAIAIAFTIGTAVIVTQTNYVRHADIGFKRDGLVLVDSFESSQLTDGQRAGLLDLWRTAPGVTAVATADLAPGVEDSISASNYSRPGMKGSGPTLNYVQTGKGFAETYGVRLIAGRTLDEAHGLDDSSPWASRQDAADADPNGPKAAPDMTPYNVLVNVNALSVLGFPNAQAALGQTILRGAGDGAAPRTIVGVIDNIRFGSPHAVIPPTVYYFQNRSFPASLAAVRYASADPKRLTEQLRASWRQVAPTVPFRAQTIEQNLETYYRPDDQRGRLFSIGAGLAVLIGCLGLYGLAAFNTARRTKEIGIRKTLGASTRDVLALLLGQFLRPVLIANLIAWPLAFIVMRGWLSTFDQRIELTPLYFIGAAVLALLVAVVTVVGQAVRVARAEPAKALRYE